jgi:DNA repair photolyase
VRLGLITKGALILRDIELLQTIHRRSRLNVHVSLVSPHPDLVRKLDPWAPPPDVRIEILRRLTEAGIDTCLALSPVLPGLTDDEASLDVLLQRVAAAGVRRLFSNVLFLRSPTREKFLKWLGVEFPRYLEAYERAYATRVYLEGPYRKTIDALVRRLGRKHGLVESRYEQRWRRPEQTRLF